MTGGALWRAAIAGVPVVMSLVIGGASYAQGVPAQVPAYVDGQVGRTSRQLTGPITGSGPGQVAARVSAQERAGKPKPIFSIDDPRVVESSGLAASTVHPGSYYTINDSGGESEVYAIDGETGEVQATIVLGEIEPYDWEAIAPGPEDRIWVGDIGDNDRVRDDITLYRFIEPDTLADDSLMWSSFDFEFTNGPRDAEALLVHPETGQVYVVSKTAGGGAIYAGPEEVSTEYTNELYKIADAPSLVTDGAFLPDGSAVVLRNYAKAFVMSWPDAEITKTIPLPKVKQGESLAVSPDGKRILIGSEGDSSPVYSISLASGEPTNTSTPKPRETEGAAGEPRDGRNQQAIGSTFGGMATWVPIFIVGIAVLAGILAFPRSRAKPGSPAAARRPPAGGPPDTPSAPPASARDAGTYGPGPYRPRRTPRLPGESRYPSDSRYPGSAYPDSGRSSEGRYPSDRPYWRER